MSAKTRLPLVAVALTFFTTTISTLLANEPTSAGSGFPNTTDPERGWTAAGDAGQNRDYLVAWAQFESMRMENRNRTASHIHLTYTTPLPLLYLEQPAVRKEMDFGGQQLDKLNRLEAEWNRLLAMQKLGLLDAAEVHERLGNGRMLSEIKAILTANQKKRLDQIILQHREAVYGFPAALPSVAIDLDLTDFQREMLDELHQRHAALVVERLAANEKAEAAFGLISEANRNYLTSVELLLTKAQRAKLDDLRGNRFTGNIRLNEPRMFKPDASTLGVELYLKSAWGYYAYEVEFLADAAVQKELRMTKEQALKIENFRAEWRTDLRQRTHFSISAGLKASSTWVDVNIGQTLDPDQVRRFREIMIQQRIRSAGLGAACGYPGIAEEIKLVRGGYRQRDLQNGKSALEVLDIDHLERLRACIGSPFKGKLQLDFDRLAESVAPSANTPPSRVVKQASLPEYLLSQSNRLRLAHTQEARLTSIAEDLRIASWALQDECSCLSPVFANASKLNRQDLLKARKALTGLAFDVCLEALDKEQRIEIKWEILERLGKHTSDARRDRVPPSEPVPFVPPPPWMTRVETDKPQVIPPPREVPRQPEVLPPPRELPREGPLAC